MKIYAIIDSYYRDDQYTLTLVKDPDEYIQEVVVSEIKHELPTTFYDIYELLDFWNPYNGVFETEVCGNLNEDGTFVEDEDNGEYEYWKYETYEKGKLIKVEYEQI